MTRFICKKHAPLQPNNCLTCAIAAKSNSEKCVCGHDRTEHKGKNYQLGCWHLVDIQHSELCKCNRFLSMIPKECNLKGGVSNA